MAQEEMVKKKKKINLLIDSVSKLQDEINKQEEQKLLLEEKIRIMQQETQSAGDDYEENVQEQEENRMLVFMKDFCLIAKLFVMNTVYIEYRYKSKNSQEYYKIEQGIFEEYVSKYAEMDLKEFLDFCVDLGIIKAEKDRRCLYNSAQIRVYYVKKLFMDIAARKEEMQEAY